MSNKTNDLTNPVGSVPYTAFGGAPNKIKTGTFSLDNPYFQQMKQVDENAGFFYTDTEWQDVSALYDRAIEWEADRANLLEQREYDKQVLEEQREYDSPEAQMLRMRQAGINPDLAGGSGSGSIGSGSGAQMAQHSIADQQGTTPFGNPYTDKQLLFEGLNTAINGISAFVNGYGVIADSISKFRMLPSQIQVNEASAGLMDAQTNEINTLLSGKERSIDLSNSMQYVGLVSDLASMIKTDASDDEFKALVAAAGINPDHADSTISAIKQAQSTPEFLQRYKTNILADREAQAELDVYTSEVFNNLVEEQLQLHELELDFGIIKQSMANKVQTFLQNSPGYLENLADIQTQSASLGAERLELAKDQFRRDLAAYQQCLDDLVVGVQDLEARNAELLKRASDNGRLLTPQEQLEFNSNLLRIDKMYSLGSQEVVNVYNILGEANRQKYYLEANSHYNRRTGRFDALVGSGLSDETIIYGNIAFGDIVRGAYTTHDLINQYSNIAMQGISIGAQFYMGSRLGKSPLGKNSSGVGIPDMGDPTVPGSRRPSSVLGGR